MLGAASYISFPAFFSAGGEPGWLSQMVMEQGISNSIWFIFIFLLQLISASLFGGFIVLMSKQNKLWAAFIMGLSFPSILSSNMGSSNDSRGKKSQNESTIDSEIPNSSTLDIHGSLFDWVGGTAYAQESNSSDNGEALNVGDVALPTDSAKNNEPTAKIKAARKSILTSATPAHRELLLEALNAKPDNVLFFRLKGDYLVQNVTVQILYQNKSVTSFSIIEKNKLGVYIPKLSGIDKIRIYGRHVEEAVFGNVGGETRNLSLVYKADFSQSMKNTVRRRGQQSGMFVPAYWTVGEIKIKIDPKERSKMRKKIRRK